MSNIIKLPGTPDTIVEFLQQLIKEAEAGKLTGFAGAVITPEGMVPLWSAMEPEKVVLASVVLQDHAMTVLRSGGIAPGYEQVRPPIPTSTLRNMVDEANLNQPIKYCRRHKDGTLESVTSNTRRSGRRRENLGPKPTKSDPLGQKDPRSGRDRRIRNEVVQDVKADPPLGSKDSIIDKPGFPEARGNVTSFPPRARPRPVEGENCDD